MSSRKSKEAAAEGPQGRDQTNPKRKKKSSKSLLVRLSESCTNHRKNCHHDDNDDDDALMNPSSQCLSDMKSLKSIIPMIESACQCQHEPSADNKKQTSRSSQQLHQGSSSRKPNQDPKEIMNLCLFYISVVDCAYCPHAMDLLFDNGSGGVEILPRVHQLFRHLASDAMVQDTIKTLKRSRNNSNRKSANVDVDENSSNREAMKRSIPSVSDQISRTCAILLNSIPEPSLHVEIVHDLIRQLRDLNAVSSMGVLDDPQIDGNTIELLIFSQARYSISTEAEETKEYAVELGSSDRLLLLQSCIYQLLFQIFVMHHCRELEMEPESEPANSPHHPLHAHTLLNANADSAFFRMDNEHCALLINCIRQVLETSSGTNLHQSQSTSMCTAILIMRNKIMVCDLLLLLLPELSTRSEAQGVGYAQWMQLVDLITTAVRIHLKDIADRSDGTSSNHSVLRWMDDSVSMHMVTLLRNIFIYPPTPCQSFSGDMWDLRSKFVHCLFDCIPSISKTQTREGVPSVDTERLSQMVLRAIHISFFPNATCHDPCSKHNFSGKENALNRMILSLFNYCKVKLICVPLLSLLSNSSYSTIVTSILTHLWNTHGANSIIYRSCEIAMDEVGMNGNKRRRLGGDASYVVDDVSKSDIDGAADSVSFTAPFAIFIRRALDESRAISACADSFGKETNQNVLDTLRKRNNTADIFNAIYVLESLVVWRKEILNCVEAVDGTLKELYEAASMLVSSLSAESNQNDIGKIQGHVIPLVAAMERILHNFKLPEGFCNGTLIHVRENFLDLLSDGIVHISFLNISQANIIFDQNMRAAYYSLTDIAEACLVGVAQHQVDQIDAFMSTYYNQCGSYCVKLLDALGIARCLRFFNFDCLCRLISNSCVSPIICKKNEELMKSSFVADLEGFLTAPQRGIMSAFFRLCYTDGGSAHLIEAVGKNVDLPSSTKISLLASFQITLVALNFMQSNSGHGVQYLPLFRDSVEAFSKIPMKDICSPLVRGDPNSPVTDDLVASAKAVLTFLSRSIAMNVIALYDGDVLKNEDVEDGISTTAIDCKSAKEWQDRSMPHRLLLESISPWHCLGTQAILPLVSIEAYYDEMITILQGIDFGDKLFERPELKRDLWDLVVLLCAFCSKRYLHSLTAICLEIDKNKGGSETSNAVTNADQEDAFASIAPKSGRDVASFEWILRTVFNDEDEVLRSYAAHYLSAAIFRNNCRLLRVLYGSIDDSVNENAFINEKLVMRLFDDIDVLLQEFCGITQLELSLTNRTAQSTGTFASASAGEEDELSMACSRQICAIEFISKLCQNAGSCGGWRSLVLEKGIMRMVGFWITASTFPFDNVSSLQKKTFANIETVAHREIRRLRDEDLFSSKAINNFDEKFVPGLISEIFSKCFFAQSLNRNVVDQESEFGVLMRFIRSFLITKTSDSSNSFVSQDDRDKVLAILSCFDNSLPTTIAGLVLEQDYESICACTSFRFYLLFEEKRLSRKFPMDASFEERVVGKPQSKKKKSYGFRRLSKEELKRQTAKLCVMNDNVLNVLGPILKSLLLASDKAPLMFFLKTVLRSEISFGKLLKISEFAILDGLMWELGKYDHELPEDDFVDGSWKLAYNDQNAFLALKGAALSLQHANESFEFSLDAQDLKSSKAVQSEELVCQWIRKYFLRLLVNVTTKWKRGRINTKISSMHTLRVLIRFLPVEESAQYVTPILGIIDGCMYLRETTLQQRDSLLSLQALAIRNLSHFTRILLAHDIKIVGANLNNIIVSILPLFDARQECKGADDGHCIATKALADAIELLEILVDGKSGRSLSSYFSSVPFLPKDSRVQNVRDILRRHGVNFDNLLLLSTQLSSEPLQRRRESSSNSLSVHSEEERVAAAQRNKFRMALKKRLSSLGKLLNHENENVRKVCLLNIIDTIRGHRELFHEVIKAEDTSLRFLTVKTDQETQNDGTSGMDKLIKALLRRCVLETNTELRHIVASCLGEIGAVSPSYMNRDIDFDKSSPEDAKKWVIEKGAPWKSNSVRIHYELQLVTKHFVVALKAAPTPTDQHKIAFAIQEDASDSMPSEENKFDEYGKRAMHPWLKSKLQDAHVLNLIEPYWTSRYKQTEATKSKSPPFFKEAKSYYLWLAEWGRFMIERSNEREDEQTKTRYHKVFFACRSAVRSETGLGVLEFLLPLLVLDSLCHGDKNGYDKETTIDELKNVLLHADNSKMDKLEVQKSVDTVFTVLHIIQCWYENEIEDRDKAMKSGRQSRSRGLSESRYSSDSLGWSFDASMSSIEDLLVQIPFDLCARAASHAGMHAQALRYLEMESRKREASVVFDGDFGHGENTLYDTNNSLQSCKQIIKATHIDSMDIALAHRLFGELGDRNSMSAISRCRQELNLFDQIRERQSYEDWDGVLQLCELASQIQNVSGDMSGIELESIQIMALLELGHFDSALNQVNGILNGKVEDSAVAKSSIEALAAHGIHASWRLGRWDSLGYLVHKFDCKSGDLESERHYDFELGKAILGLQERDHVAVSNALRGARETIIPPLSVVASEDYPRAYPYLLKLQCLREVEDASRILCKYETANGSVPSKEHLDEIVHPSSFAASTLNHAIAARLAISRIAIDSELEASLWLFAGRKARKEGFFHLAETSLSHADALYQQLKLIVDESDNNLTSLSSTTQRNANEVRLQLAKLKHKNGKATEALNMIRVSEFESILLSAKKNDNIEQLRQKLENGAQIKLFARKALQASEWMIESGLQSGSQAVERYKLLNIIAPNWERAHFKYAKYLDSVLESRISVVISQNVGNADDESARAKIIEKEKSCHVYILEAIKEYGEASRLSQKHIFEALPRLLTLWFDFTSIAGDDELGYTQDQVNELMVNYMRSIPPVAFYSVLPQLISRIGHNDENTASVVRALLRRLLVKFPAQVMWHLAWLRQSVHKDRQQIGEDIFKGAQRSLRKSENMKMHDLLQGSKSLVQFLINLAKHNPKHDKRTFNIQPNAWKGAGDLREYLPPVQSALTVSRSESTSDDSWDAFPRQVPRIRTFSQTIQTMSSKAKPKKLTAFAVADGSKATEASGKNENKKQATDIGEMHFLVKREAKGDLRKDARVQDLNTVINRLFAHSSSSQSAKMGQHRRLKLRTFSVVCLSEDCGILEWVPNTDSFRNLVGESYNPHANPRSKRRRGKRVTDFLDATLRTSFIECQEEYTKKGNLTKAAQMFDDVMLKEYPPLFYWWFVRNFQDPHKWFEARTRFALSAASWAAVGHVIGLGDRHSENILLDRTCGECVHVDFDCIFDKGLTLPRPEVIPFRLTPNMLDGFGPTGADGSFSGGLKSAMGTLRDNRDILLSVLEPFLRDPVIDWRGKSSQQLGDSDNSQAKRSIRVIDERLRGIYNLKNPNYKKIKRKDRQTHIADDEMASMMPLSLEGQVQKMIAEATSHENLVQIYVGWMPWL